MKPAKKFCPVLAFLVSLLLPPFYACRVSAETYNVDGREIEVTLAPQKPTIMLGEPIYLSFKVQNHSQQDLQVLVGGDYRNALGRPESFKVTVANEDGKIVPQPKAGAGFGGLFGPQKVPAQGNYTFGLFLPHWATFEKPGTYSIVATRTLKLSKYSPGEWDAREKTTDVKVQADTKIEILPLDQEKMGEVIAGLGDELLRRTESDGYILSYIQDERIIPYFVKSLEGKNHSRKSRALRTLGRFNNESAFEAIKKGMDTTGEDIGNASTKEVADQLADSIRHTAANALAGSPHPGAIPFLLSRRNDTYRGVRITILHVLGKMNPAEALPILQEMSQDKNKSVSDEAKRYQKLLSARQ